MDSKLPHGDVTKAILIEFYYLYNRLGHGFVEVIYSRGLERRLRSAGHEVAREYHARVMLDGEQLGFQRLDMVIDQCVVVEVKSTQRLDPFSRRQLYNYLRATNLEVGLLLHFGPEPRFQRVFVPHR